MIIPKRVSHLVYALVIHARRAGEVSPCVSQFLASQGKPSGIPLVQDITDTMQAVIPGCPP